MIVFKFICTFLSGLMTEVQWGSRKIPAMFPLLSHDDALLLSGLNTTARSVVRSDRLSEMRKI